MHHGHLNQKSSKTIKVKKISWCNSLHIKYMLYRKICRQQYCWYNYIEQSHNKYFKHCNFFTAILALYLNRKLHFDQSISTAILHLNDFLVYFFTIIGAVVGDSWWGSYKTIAWMMVVYLFGTVIVSVGAIESFYLPIM